MINLRSNKGITLMAQVITIVVLMIVLGVITYSSMANMQIRDLNNMYADISNIQDRAANYYLKYGEAPIDKNTPISSDIIPMAETNPNDEYGQYYKVDFSKLLNITLNNKQTAENYYYMNEKTLTTYYSTGVTVKVSNSDVIYHTLPSNYENVEKIDVLMYQSER